MEAMLWPSVVLVRFVSQDLPNFICGFTFFVPTLLSGFTFYLFFQNMSFLFIFSNSMLATLSTQVITFLVGDATKPAGAIEVLRNPIRGVAYCYVYFSVFRVLFFFGFTIWTAMWEMAYDFPTLRVVLLGRKRAGFTDESRSPMMSKSMKSMSRMPLVPKNITGLSDNSSESGNFDDDDQLLNGSRNLKRKVIFIITPWVFLVGVSLAMVGMQSRCLGWLQGAGQDFGCAFFDPEARLNRSLRMASFLLAAQFIQVFLMLFPTWHEALAQARWSLFQITSVVSFCVLVPLTISSFLLWCLSATGTAGQAMHTMGLALPMPLQTESGRVVGGSLLQISWFVWVLLTTSVLVSAENLEASGYTLSKLKDMEYWSDKSAMFKCTIPFTMMIVAVRSCTARGIAHAQNDIVTFTVVYPWLFCMMWTFTFVVVRISTYTTSRLQVIIITIGIVFLGIASWYLAHAVQEEGTGDMPVLVFFVWFSICGEYLRVLKRWSNWAHSVRLAALNNKQPPIRQKSIKIAAPTSAESVTVKIFFVVVRVFIIAIICFCSILGICALMATVQNQTGFFFKDIVLWESSPSGIQITNAGASVLKLPWPNATSKSSAKLPRDYMVCGQTWHGLQALDFAFLSELPYFKPKPENDLPLLLKSLMPNHNISLVRTAGSAIGMRPWMEFELVNDNGKETVSIVSVSGTAVDHVSDYLENIRMWTEPIVLMIINFIFPLTRTWGRETTALFIGSQHRMMGALGVRDQEWQYGEVLERVRELKAKGREVVLTGHSLGGGIALVVGALTGQMTIALQPPGVYHSLAKHQAIQQGHHAHEGGDALHKKSLSLVVEGDWIQHFDQHGGLVQTMGCDHQGKSLAVGCHLLEGAICHLIRHCGDISGRFATCQHEYNPVATTVAIMGNIAGTMKDGWAKVRDQLFGSKQQILSMLLSGLVLFITAFFRFGVPFHFVEEVEEPLEPREMN